MRLSRLNLILPKTREFLVMLYGSESNYASYNIPWQNPYWLLEDVCMMYDYSFVFEYSAVKGLEMLKRAPGSVCTLSGRCSSTCAPSCLCQLKVINTNGKKPCGMDPRAQLHDVLMKILSSREEIDKYLVR